MEKFTFFYRSQSPFSQWYPASFVIEGITFNCAEQYMMYVKAILFNDEEMAKKIIEAKDPGKQKALGRAVRNFDPAVWEKERLNIVYKGNYAKFTQNEELKKHLLKTAGTTLVEASPRDTIWGIGLGADNPRSQDRSTWRGKNLLGEVLTRLRGELMKEL